MTTLFNLFCPFIIFLSLNNSIFMLVSVTMLFSAVVLLFFNKKSTKEFINIFCYSLFPSLGITTLFMSSLFFLLSLLNTISLVTFSYPVTTTLSFNFGLASMLWFCSILTVTLKEKWASSFLPVNSPWYLVPFLALVEMISISVRPVTLCFRLLANMTAGHILLALMCKLPFNTWLIGVFFGLLELLVSLVQAFVFAMLISVYLEESINH